MYNILYLMECDGVGGAESMLVNLINRLDKKKFHPVVCLLKDDEWLYKELIKNNVDVVVIPLKKAYNPIWIYKALRFVRKRNIHLIHAHEFLMNVYGTAVGKLAQIPVITTVHGKSYYWEKKHRAYAYKFTAKFSKMITVSEELKHFLKEKIGIDYKNLQTIYNGIDLARFNSHSDCLQKREELNIDKRTKIVGAVGNLYPVKGHTYFLKAAAEILETESDVIFLIIGRGYLAEQLKQEAKDLGIYDYVRFLGFRSDVPELLKIMDIYVSSSLSECLSLSILEAMASGLPVVATNVGGNSEIIADGENGFLVESEDPNRLADRVLYLIKNDRIAKNIGERGRERIREKFDLKVMIKSYEELYYSLVKIK